MTQKVQFPGESRLSSETNNNSLLVEWGVEGISLIKDFAHRGCFSSLPFFSF